MHGSQRWTYAQYYGRARQLASALSKRGIGAGDTVSVMLANTPPMLEAHYGVPMTGAVLHSINTRLDAAVIAFMLDHAETKIVITDTEFSPVMKEALAQSRGEAGRHRLCRSGSFRAGRTARRATTTRPSSPSGDPEFEWRMPGDEWDAISLNYTSGTTGNPKGVVYHHRGAYLLALGNILAGSIGRHPVYLWTLPMFHCNGWCFPWTVPVVGGTNVCLRYVRADAIWNALAGDRVTHLCGAPIVMSTILNAPPEQKRELDTQGASSSPPPRRRPRPCSPP